MRWPYDGPTKFSPLGLIFALRRPNGHSCVRHSRGRHDLDAQHVAVRRETEAVGHSDKSSNEPSPTIHITGLAGDKNL